MSPETIRADQRVAAVPIELGVGEMRRWTLGAGNYSLTMVPYADSIGGLRLRIERANCVKEPFPRRYGCFTPDSTIVTLWHPGRTVSGAKLKGGLLVQRN